jgi:hypothetical protein
LTNDTKESRYLPGVYEKACGEAVAAVKAFMDGL